MIMPQNNSINNNPTLCGVGDVHIPAGDDSQRPSNNFGKFRMNTESGFPEYSNLLGGWTSLNNAVPEGTVFSNGLGTTGQIPLYTSDGYNIGVSAATDSGTLFTINYGGGPQFLVSEGGTVSTLNNTLDDGSGNLTTFGNVTVGNLAGAGQNLFLPTNTYNTYDPTITSSNSGVGGFSTLTLNSDNFAFNIDPSQTFTISTSTPTLVFGVAGNGEVITLNNTLDDGSGNLLTAGNVTIGQGETGATLFMPIAASDTYSPNAVSSSNAGFSMWTFSSDAFTFNLDNAEQGQFQVLGSGSHAAFGVSAQNGGGFGIDAVSFNASYYQMDLFVYGSEELGFPYYFSVNNVSSPVGQVTTLHNVLDDGGGNMTLAGSLNVYGSDSIFNINKNSTAFAFNVWSAASVDDFALRIDTSSFNNLSVGQDLAVDGIPPGYVTYFHVIGNSVNGQVGQINTLFNQLDDGLTGTAQFAAAVNAVGNITSNSSATSSIILGNDGSGNAEFFFTNTNGLGLEYMYYEPVANTLQFSTPISIISGGIPTP